MAMITRKYEFDAGHRIPSHASKCRHLHGHRYVVEVTVEGDVKPLRGATDDGMVTDFGDLKLLIGKAVDGWDHAMLLYRDDPLVTADGWLGGAGMTGSLGIVKVWFIPTVENLALVIRDRMEALIADPANEMKGVRVYNVRLYETPNCWADTHTS